MLTITRFFLTVSGDEYWIVGHSALYICVAVFFGLCIIEEHVPAVGQRDHSLKILQKLSKSGRQGLPAAESRCDLIIGAVVQPRSARSRQRRLMQRRSWKRSSQISLRARACAADSRTWSCWCTHLRSTELIFSLAQLVLTALFAVDIVINYFMTSDQLTSIVSSTSSSSVDLSGVRTHTVERPL